MHVLVVKLSSLGDVLHALPAVHALRVGAGATVDWVTQTEYRALVACFPDVDRVICFPRHRLANLPEFVRELRQSRYDLAVDLQGLLKSALVTRLARTRRRIGPSFHREGTRPLYHAVCGPRAVNRHAVDQCLDVVTHLGLPRCEPVFPLRLPAFDLGGGRPCIGVCPFSRWATKNWAAERFVDVARRLHATAGGSFYILGGSAEAAACRQLATAIGPHARSLAGEITLVQAAAAIRNMDLLIANDSGPVHLAAAVGTPVVVVFGPTDPARTGPYGPRHRIVRADLSCQPCYQRRCAQRPTCMDAVSVTSVVEAALGLLEELK